MFYKMTVVGSPLWKCGIRQTAWHLIESCDLYKCPGGVDDIYTLNSDSGQWVLDLKVGIWSDKEQRSLRNDALSYF